MRCPKCGHEESKVIDSRSSENNDAIRIPITVVKKDGHKEPFDRQKLMRGLVAATVKRDISVASLDQFIDGIESQIRDKGQYEIKSEDLGSIVLKNLVMLDKVAYIRFASVYRDFKDVDEFSAELRSLN